MHRSAAGATSIVFDDPRATTAVKLRLHRKSGDRRYLAALAVQSSPDTSSSSGSFL